MNDTHVPIKNVLYDANLSKHRRTYIRRIQYDEKINNTIISLLSLFKSISTVTCHLQFDSATTATKAAAAAKTLYLQNSD